MPTIDLGAAAPPAPDTADVWAALPRRVGLTVAELSLLAETIGAPLPFDLTPPQASGGGGLAARLGVSASATQDQAYVEALARLGDPAESLRRRGLLTGSAPHATVDAGIAGALGLLAAPSVAVDLDVAVEAQRAHAWHRFRDRSVATLATADGLVFELAWFAATAWPAELARVAVLPDETRLRSSLVPAELRVPWQVADASSEAIRSGRPELVPVIAGDAALGTILTALAGEAHGRLRALVTHVASPGDDAHDAEEAQTVGVAAWTLLADGWHALRPHRATAAGETTDNDQDDLLAITQVAAEDLAAELAPLLAEVA